MFIFLGSSQTPAQPQQKRSKARRENILAAAEHMLRKRLFEDVPVTKIAKHAKVPVGTIYQQFQSKDALLPALFARHHQQVAATIAPLLEGLAAESKLDRRVKSLVQFAVNYHVEHRGLLRALTVYTRSHPQDIEPEVFKQRHEQYRQVAALLIGSAAGRKRNRRLDDAMFALGVINSVCREQLLFDDTSPIPPQESDLPAFTIRLVRMVSMYLTPD